MELPPDGVWRILYETPEAQALDAIVTVAAAPVADLTPPGPEGWTSIADFPAVAPTVDRPDPAIYDRDAFYPEAPVVAGDVQWQQGRRLLPLRVFPFQYNPVSGAVRYLPDVQITVEVTPSGPANQTEGRRPATLADNRAAVTPGAVRIRTDTQGLHRLTYSDLAAAGVPVDADPASFAISYLGRPAAIEVIGEADGRFDPDDLVVFYAEPYVGRYQRDNVYWFTYGGAPGLRMATRTVTPTGNEPVVTTITRTLHVEFDRDYRTTFPLPQDADHWFDLPLSPDELTATPIITRSYELALVDPLATGTVQIRAALHGGADRPSAPDKSIALYLNNHWVATHQWEGMTYYSAQDSAPAAWLDGAAAQVHLVAAIAQLPGVGFYSVSPDWVQVSYPALASAQDDRLFIEAMTAGASQVRTSGWSTAEVRVYDLRDPSRPVRLLTTAALPAGGGYAISFWDANLPGPTYALSSLAALLAPLAVEADTPSSWGAPGHAADYIAIVHRSLWDAIDPLLAHRAAEGLRVAKVDVQDIYDEWSYGRRDPEAIRSFLSYAYRCWNGAPCEPAPGTPPAPPRYVLLVGEGHYDFTGASGTAVPNLIPPYLIHIDPWFGETAADNRFVSVDGPDDFLPDMAVGRIPARTAADVTAVVDKIIAYETVAPAGEWQQRVVFVADNNLDPAGNFHALSDDVRLNWLPSAYDSRTIYYNRDYFSGPQMRTAIKNAFNDDALLLQWFGHGTVIRWGSVSMFNIFDMPALATNDTWPFATSYTCYSGYFIYIANGYQSLAEATLLAPQQGSIADFSSSGAHLGGSLLILNRGLAQAVFQQRTERVGDAVDAAKLIYFGQASSFHSLIDTYILFGDPALKLRLPDQLLAGSTLEASRAWAPAGRPITVTATLSSTAALSTTAALTLTLPAGLGDPTALAASSSTAQYDPASRQVTWRGVVSPGTAEIVSFSSAFLPGAAACSEATVAGQVQDGLAAMTALSVTVQAASPDVNCDGRVDIVDIQQVTARWGAAQGDPLYHPRYDLDGDDQIGVPDVIIAAQAW